jgi:hypothetical protein
MRPQQTPKRIIHPRLPTPPFFNAVQRFLDRKGQGVENYMEDLGKK